jgi:nicotinamide riboside transporter PnuC
MALLLCLEWAGLICVIAALYLNGKQNVWNWPVSCIGCACLTFYFAFRHDWPMMLMDMFMFYLSVIGWIKWVKYDKRK